MNQHGTYELTAPPEYWDIALRDGSTLVVIAHAYCVDGAEVVFSLPCKGTPNFVIESLRISVNELRAAGRIGPKGTMDITGDKWMRPRLSGGC